MKRQYCSDCSYPRKTCVCHAVSPMLDTPDILVLQHYREAKHAKNTVKLARLCLPRLTVMPVKDDNDVEHCFQQISHRKYAIFYPTEEGQLLDTNKQAFRAHKYDLIVFIDGSWRQSKGIFRCITTLIQPEIWHFNPHIERQYKIRHTRLDGAFSTLEAIAMALNKGFDQDATPLYQLFSAFQSHWPQGDR